MPNSPHESQHPDNEVADALKLNKETLSELDVDATDAQAVKGGGFGTIKLLNPNDAFSTKAALSSRPSGSSVPSGAIGSF